MGERHGSATIDKIAAGDIWHRLKLLQWPLTHSDPSMALTATSVLHSSSKRLTLSTQHSDNAQTSRQSLQPQVRFTAKTNSVSGAASRQRHLTACQQQQRGTWRCSSVVDGAGASMDVSYSGPGVEPGGATVPMPGCRDEHPPLHTLLASPPATSLCLPIGSVLVVFQLC